RIYGIVVAIILLGSLSQFVAAFTIPRSAALPWIVFNSFHWEFAGGCALAYLLIQRGPLRQGLFWLSLGTVGVLGFSFAQSYGLIQEVNAIPIAGTELLITRVIFTGIPCLAVVLGAASLDMRGRFKIPGWLWVLGNASYSIYLVHSPVISACTQIIAKLGLPNGNGVLTLANCAIALLSIALGLGFYYGLERPLLQALKPHLP
ncbi:MAG: acyltransferase, partial [Spirulina sp. SIO3F2]|nr:acyltransferase [Spirulina sp. SIO3F2]